MKNLGKYAIILFSLFIIILFAISNVPANTAVYYHLPYLHTSTNNVVYCLTSNMSSENMTVSFTVDSADNDTPTSTTQTFSTASLLKSSMTRQIAFSGKTASVYSPVTGYETLTLSSTDVGTSGAYGGTLSFIGNVSFDSSGIQASCLNILMTCLQGLTAPKRAVTGILCEDNVTGYTVAH
ncbi:MAG: hypothetical protein HQK88_09515 [Nitrospirae bacterium]|nr:hypothetical protein [Nitrospirota bacterium]MBF0534148.1 hypothetical protein [Nitrospirota bacterium]MBF0617035.1 hypothetical protein [Nitrospirota bacterium]